MRRNSIVKMGFTALLVLLSVQNALASIAVTTANDYVQFTGENPITYTGTNVGSYTIAGSSYDASGSLQITRSGSSLDYLWSATSDFYHTKGVGIRAIDRFALSAGSYQLTFTGSYLDGYLLNTDTNTYVEKFGFKSGNVGPTPDFTISLSLLAGNYELRLNTGALPLPPPNINTASGEVHFKAVPVPGALWLLGSGLVGLASLRRRMTGQLN